jgi:hypothetical protein
LTPLKINPKPETLNPTQELLKKKLSANLGAESWKRASELLKKKLSANLRAENPRKERASGEISVEIDELIGSREELFLTQELGSYKRRGFLH